MMHHTTCLLLACGLLSCSTAAIAQPGHEGHDHGTPVTKPVMVQPASTAPVVPAMPAKTQATFRDEELKSIAMMLSGCRKAPLPGRGEVILAVAPVGISGATDTMYAELSFANAMNRPFRQTIWQLTKTDGKVYLKTYEFRTKPDHLVGMWAVPEAFPGMSLEGLNPTMEMVLTKQGKGHSGKTLKPYPTNASGATTMTSAIAFDGESFQTSDRGFDAQGKAVWGPEEGATGYAFTHYTGCPKANRMDGGIIVIDYPSEVKGGPAKPGERMSVDYYGYLESGRMFDASYSRGSPFIYTKGDKMIEGWNLAMADAGQGTTRRIIIPAALGHADDTNRGRVPPNSTLIYDVKVLGVGPNALSSTPPQPPVIKTGGPGAVNPNLQPVDPNDPIIKKMEADMRARMEAKAKAAREKAEKEAQDKKQDPAAPAPTQPAPAPAPK